MRRSSGSKKRRLFPGTVQEAEGERQGSNGNRAEDRAISAGAAGPSTETTDIVSNVVASIDVASGGTMSGHVARDEDRSDGASVERRVDGEVDAGEETDQEREEGAETA